jgi:uncharacterized membrane protein YcfT
MDKGQQVSPQASALSQVRFHYLDFSRGLFLTLGIVLHAAALYSARNPLFGGTFDFIRSFRMQAFFLLAGFFAAFMQSLSA